MAKLHEILASEKSANDSVNTLILETRDKFNKREEFFNGRTKTLTILEDRPDKAALEAAGAEKRELRTNVVDTLAYMFRFWMNREDILFQKNKSNQSAMADIEFRGKTVASSVPVDQLMGLEARLTELRGIFMIMPTLDAAKAWKIDPQLPKGVWSALTEEVTTKTEKITVPVVLYAATKEHPAQVKESHSDKVIGTFVTRYTSGAVSALQKAEAIETIDTLLVEVKKARNRANMCEASTGTIGKAIIDLIMEPLTKNLS